MAKASLISSNEACVDFGLGAILDDEALPLAGASQLGVDRQDDRIEIRPLARSFRLQRRGDLRPAQANFDPIGRDGCSLDNIQDEAFYTTSRRPFWREIIRKPKKECASRRGISRRWCSTD